MGRRDMGLEIVSEVGRSAMILMDGRAGLTGKKDDADYLIMGEILDISWANLKLLAT